MLLFTNRCKCTNSLVPQEIIIKQLINRKSYVKILAIPQSLLCFPLTSHHSSFLFPPILFHTASAMNRKKQGAAALGTTFVREGGTKTVAAATGPAATNGSVAASAVPCTATVQDTELTYYTSVQLSCP